MSYALRSVLLLSTAEPTTPVESGRSIPVAALAGVRSGGPIPIQSAGLVELRAGTPIPIQSSASTIVLERGSAIPIAASGRDSFELPLRWTVLRGVDAPFPLSWIVVPADPLPGAELPLRWSVVEDLDALVVSWRVVPTAVRDLFDADGAGVAAGMPADVQRPVGKAMVT